MWLDERDHRPIRGTKPRPGCRDLLGVQRQDPQPASNSPSGRLLTRYSHHSAVTRGRSRTLPPGPAGGQSGPTLARFALASSTRAAVSAATPTLLAMAQRSHHSDADPGDERFRNRTISAAPHPRAARLLWSETGRRGGLSDLGGAGQPTAEASAASASKLARTRNVANAIASQWVE